MRPICARKMRTRNEEWELGMRVAVADVAVPFLRFLNSLFAAFLLVSQTFARRLTISRHFSLFSARCSRQSGAIAKDFMETFSVSFLASKLFLFQAIQFSQTVLIHTIQFRVITISMSKTIIFQTIQLSISLNIKTVQFQVIYFSISMQISSI